MARRPAIYSLLGLFGERKIRSDLEVLRRKHYIRIGPGVIVLGGQRIAGFSTAG